MACLVLVRHGKSEWNALGLLTGWDNVELHDEGVADAKRAAAELKKAYTSNLTRAKQTDQHISDLLGLAEVPVSHHDALNERHFGIYQGKNKWQVKEEVGEETFQKIRRSWDHPIPEGETSASIKSIF